MKAQFKHSYDQDINILEDKRQLFKYGILILLLLLAPWLLSNYYISELSAILIWSISGLGLMLLTGHTGQVSLGHAAFMAIGAFSHLALMSRGWNFIPALIACALITGVIGALIARPILRTSGIYLAIATLALSIIIEDIAIVAEPITGGISGTFAPPITMFGFTIDRYITPKAFYYLCLTLVTLITFAYVNLLRSSTGRSFLAIRDSEVSARALGVNVPQAKTLAFSISCAITAIGGAMYGHFVQAVNYESFTVIISITILLQIVIGGLGSIHGAFFGAIVVVLLPQVIAILGDTLSQTPIAGVTSIPGVDTALFALVIVIMIIYEPRGIYGIWIKVRTWFRLFPLYRKGLFRRSKTYLKTERMR